MAMQFLRPVRFYFWYINAFVIRHTKILILFFIVGFFITLFSLFTQNKQEIAKNKLILGLSGIYSINNLPKSIQNLLSYGLTQVQENGEITNLAAEKIIADKSGTLYEISLKSDLVWHDGTTFTSEDVNYNFKEVDKKIIDQKTLQFTLKEPFSPFLSLLSQPIFKKGLIGLGPYKLGRVNFEEDKIKSLELIPTNNQQYLIWPKDFPIEVINRISPKTKLVINFYPTSEMVKKALKLGQIDTAIGLKNDTSFLDKWYDINTFVDYTHVVSIFLNTKDYLLKDKIVRQALAYAIPKEIYDNKNRAIGPITPISWAYNGKIKKYEFNLDTAKELFGKINIATGEAKPRIVLSTFPQFNSLAEGIAESWRNLGFSVDVAVQTSIPPTYQALLFSQEIPMDPDQYTLWHSTQVGNITGYTSARNDKLLEDGRTIIDQEKRSQKYFDFQKYLVEDEPAIFLYYPTVYTISRK